MLRSGFDAAGASTSGALPFEAGMLSGLTATGNQSPHVWKEPFIGVSWGGGGPSLEWVSGKSVYLWADRKWCQQGLTDT